MNWIEWKGEKVGGHHSTVCLCVYTYVDDGDPVIAIIPRAYCEGLDKNERACCEWFFFEGDTSIWHSLHSVPRKTWKRGEYVDKKVDIYDPTRGDKIFYCVPTLPDGDAFSLNDIKKRLYKGLSVVRARTDLVQEKDLIG